MLNYSGLTKIKNIRNNIIIDLMTTHYCNLNCSYCLSKNRMKNKQQLTIFEYDMLLINIYNKFNNYDYIELILNGGEPFLHPNLSYFVEQFLNLFPQSNITILTNGLLYQNINNLINKIQKNINRVSLCISYHCDVNIDLFCFSFNTYYDYIKTSVRILSSFEDQKYLHDLNILKKYTKSNIALKLIKKNKNDSDLLNLNETILKETSKFITYNNRIYSFEDIIFFKKYNIFKNYICFPQLFIELDGTYYDRFCLQQNKYIKSNIFKNKIDINIYKVICNQPLCIHSCDLLNPKYLI